MRDLTPKQQEKVRVKVVKTLLAAGFQTELDCSGVPFYWRKVRINDQEERICITCGGWSQFSQKRDDGWMFQRNKLGQKPAFGYSGTTHIGAAFATVEKIMDEMFWQFWSAGIAHYSTSSQKRISDAKDKITAALTLVRDAL